MTPSVCPRCGHKKYRLMGAWVCYLCDNERYLFLWHLKYGPGRLEGSEDGPENRPEIGPKQTHPQSRAG